MNVDLKEEGHDALRPQEIQEYSVRMDESYRNKIKPRGTFMPLNNLSVFQDEISAKPKNKVDFWISSFVCRFFALIISSAICVTASCRGYPLFFALAIGLCIDVLRWNFSPDLKISPYQRRQSFQRAIDDKKYRKYCRSKFNAYTAWIYWSWWVFVPFLLLSGAQFMPNMVSLIQLFYPFLRPVASACMKLSGCSSEILIEKFISETWIFMILAIISEISGGAYYYFHRPIPGIVVGEQSLSKSSKLRKSRFLLIVACLVVTYSLFGIAKINISHSLVALNSQQSSNFAGSVVRANLVYSLFISGLALMCSAGCIRALYAYFLLRTCIVLPPP